MKTLLVGLNAKHIHSNLAIRLLCVAARLQGHDVHMLDTNINRAKNDILQDVLDFHADIIGFSCYIWNISLVRSLSRDIKALFPSSIVIWGGPEVSFDSQNFLCEEVDYILAGEAEGTFPKLLKAIENDTVLDGITGLTSRFGKYADGDGVADMGTMEQVLSADLYKYASLQPGQLAYVETTRGCPLNCAYCLSAPPLRVLPWVQTQKQLYDAMRSGARTVKLVDRTFNADRQHTLRLLDFLLEQQTGVCFHLELEAHFLTDEILKRLTSAPPGRFQVELGVQSTNRETLRAIGRPEDFTKIARSVDALHPMNNIHIHLDLIAGLPFEDYATFARSFNEVYALKPHMLQLGFLKLLRGCRLREEAEQYGIVYQSDPPYEVLKTDWLSYEELRSLHGVEEMLDRFGGFERSMESLSARYGGMFEAFEALAEYWKRNDYHHTPPAQAISGIVLREMGVPIECLRWDFLYKGAILPPWLETEPEHRKIAREWFAREGSKWFDDWAALPPRQRERRARLEYFDGWWLFIYEKETRAVFIGEI